MDRKFICEDELEKSEIAAAMREGDLKFWRLDADGRRWFERMPTIHGTPTNVKIEAEDDDGDDEFEPDDDILAMSDDELGNDDD